MTEYALVSSKEELKQALKSETRNIIITNQSLADNVVRIKTASKVALVAVVGGAGVAAVSFWNPVGWTAGAVGIAAGGATLTPTVLALSLSASLIFLIYNGYSIKGKGKYTAPDGSVFEGEVILEKK